MRRIITKVLIVAAVVFPAGLMGFQQWFSTYRRQSALDAQLEYMLHGTNVMLSKVGHRKDLSLRRFQHQVSAVMHQVDKHRNDYERMRRLAYQVHSLQGSYLDKEQRFLSIISSGRPGGNLVTAGGYQLIPGVQHPGRGRQVLPADVGQPGDLVTVTIQAYGYGKKDRAV